jgi:hypothetical protein
MAERLVYTAHARRRMAERAITETEVETVLDRWETQHTDRDGNPVYGSLVAGRPIRVVVAAGSIPRRIITVYL